MQARCHETPITGHQRRAELGGPASALLDIIDEADRQSPDDHGGLDRVSGHSTSR